MSASEAFVPSQDEVAAPLVEAVRRATPFADLQDGVLSAVAALCERRAYEKGETIYSLGQFDGSELFIIESGSIKASVMDAQSGAMLIERLGAGEVFGLAAAVAGTEDAAGGVTMTAEEDATLVAIDAAQFRELVAQRPTLTRALMHHFARALAGATLGPVAADLSPERRVYAALLEFVERDAVRGDWRIPRMPKHRELAERADVDESVAAAAVAQLIQDNVARRDYPGLVIENMTQLNRLAS